MTPATLLDDSPAQIATGAGLYLPQDYDHAWKGFVSARTALGASLNVPAVRVGAMVGTDALLRAPQRARPRPAAKRRLVRRLARAGQRRRHAARLTNAYRTLANGGLASAVLLKPAAAAAPRRVADAAAGFLVTDILADNNARVRTFGWASPLATRGFAAVKTGTSKDMRDNWCVGFTDRYTIGVWAGNASGEAMHDVSGVSGAAPVWQAIAAYLHAGAPSRPPGAPAGVVAQHVAFDVEARGRARRILPRRQPARAAPAERRGRRCRALRHQQPARRQHLRDRPGYPAGRAAHHLRGRARGLAPRRPRPRRGRPLALGAVAGPASARAGRLGRPDAAERRLRSTRRRRHEQERQRALAPVTQRRRKIRSIAASMTSPHRL